MKKKVVKKADGGTTAVDPRVARMNQRATDMGTRFADRISDMKARMATMPKDRQAQFGEQIANRQDKFNDRVADMKARATQMGTRFADQAARRPAPPATPGAKKGGTMKTKKYAAGGLAGGHKSADGIAKKGKTKGKEVTMKKGGMMKGKKGC